MEITSEKHMPESRKSFSNIPKRFRFPLKFLLLLIVAVGAMNCGPRIVRVPVSEKDLIKAFEYTKEGNEAYERKEYYTALIKYLMASNLNPNSEYINNYIGITYLQLKFYKRAIEAFKHSIALNPDYASAVNNLGSAYFADGNYKKAEKYFKKAIRMKQDEASFYLNLGTLYFEMKKPEKAIPPWRKSLALNPEILTGSNSISVSISGENMSLKDRYYFLARIYASSGNIPKTIESLQNALMHGFSEIEKIRTNPDFDSMREDGRFIKFLKDAEAWETQE